MSEISVFSFNDYREFLKATFARRKASGLTLARFSKMMGFNSANYASLVLDGKRNLTAVNIFKAAKALHLTFPETEYFEALVHSSHAESTEERRFYRQRLKNIKKEQPRSSARLSSPKMFREWYFPAVLTALDRTPKASAMTKITALMPVTTEKAREIIDLLLKEVLLKEEEGVYLLNYSHQIFHDEKSVSLAHKNYLSSQMEVSRRMLQKSYERGAKFYSHTYSISEDDFAYYEDKMRSLLAEITARSDATAPDAVVQLNAQLFRVGPECF